MLNELRFFGREKNGMHKVQLCKYIDTHYKGNKMLIFEVNKMKQCKNDIAEA
jgi:hypothetical protein